MRALSAEAFAGRAQAWLLGRWEPLAAPVQDRARTLAEVYGLTDFLFLTTFVVDPEDWDRGVRQHPAFAEVLQAASRRYAAIEDWNVTAIREATVAAGEDAGVTQLRKAQEPIRLAVMGRAVGLPMLESLEVLGQDRTLARLAAALRRATAGA
jgi:glutamyl-tRNA synthetase